jgi:carbonic anhydrase
MVLSGMPDTEVPTLSPPEALQRLVEGNRRFLKRGGAVEPRSFDPKQAEKPQNPFAIVLGCSDSRTPVEILFDAGFGELFVVRIAGNIVAPSIVGSIEFAAGKFGTGLVVVLGHTRCGAIEAAVKATQSGNGPESKNIRDITERISPHIEELVRASGGSTEPALLREAMRANVRASVNQLRHGHRLLEELVSAGRLAIVGAEYELETGKVHLLDGLSQVT